MKKLLTLLVFMACITAIRAHYSIHSASKDVLIESGGKQAPAKPGIEVKANDYLIIPEGQEVEIYNDLDKNIYKSLSSGKISVTRLMIDAKKMASNNNKNVASRLSLAKNSNSVEGEKIYTEKGMVRRSLAVFDPEAENIQINSKTLGQLIANFILNHDSSNFQNVDVELTNGKLDTEGYFFRVVNNQDFPVYFNVMKFDLMPETPDGKMEISVLGQPDGNYVLLPGQAITRETFSSLPEDERHFLVMTHFRYELDEVIEETANSLSNPDSIPSSSLSFPLLIKSL
ncbi:MAG: hypothetical protein J1D77_08975 [Muribaculaceae bacterium]|nr:hypothetical protein [Muribaculaceae bacterium]